MSQCASYFANHFYAIDGLELLSKCLVAYCDLMNHLMMHYCELMHSYNQQSTKLFQGSVNHKTNDSYRGT